MNLYLRLLVLYIITVFILHVIPTGSSISLNRIEFGSFRADYLLHTLVFLPWMILVKVHYLKSEKPLPVKAVASWFLAGILFAALCETVQLVVPYRSFNPYDLIFNVSGVIFGYLFFLVPNSWLEKLPDFESQ